MPPMNITQIEQARAEYTPSAPNAQSLIPDASAHGGYNPAEVRAEYEGRLAQLQHEFERPVPGRHATPRRPYQNTWGAPLTDEQRAAAERTMRAKSQLIRHRGQLPIDDAIKIPTPPPSPARGGRGVAAGDGEGPTTAAQPHQLPKPPPPTPRRPAATYQTVIPDQPARTLPSGMLRRELKLPRPEQSRYEHLAQGCYKILSHEARLLLRILDTTRDNAVVLDPINFMAVPFGELLACFRRDGEPGYEGWEHVNTFWNAVDELVQAQILCVLPGAAKGIQAVFVAEHALRTMLASRVLNEPHTIALARVSDAVVNAAQASLRSRNVA